MSEALLASLETMSKSTDRLKAAVLERRNMVRTMRVPEPDRCVHPHICHGHNFCQRKPFVCTE